MVRRRWVALLATCIVAGIHHHVAQVGTAISRTAFTAPLADSYGYPFHRRNLRPHRPHRTSLRAAANSSRPMKFDPHRLQGVPFTEKVDFELWLEKKLSDEDLIECGVEFFNQTLEERKASAARTRRAMRLLVEAYVDEDEEFDSTFFSDAVWLHAETLCAEDESWCGPDPWVSAYMANTIPGSEVEDAARALRRGFSDEVAKPREVEGLVDNFVHGTWGTVWPSGRQPPGDQQTASVASTSPTFAILQLALGALWGYACRSLVVRWALDRTLAASVTSASNEGQMEAASVSSEEVNAGAEGKPVSLLSYVTSFFSHDDWASLCRLSDATAAALEQELEDAMSFFGALAKVERKLQDEVEDEDAEETMFGFKADDRVVFTTEVWRKYQSRGVLIGAGLADTEAWLESIVGEQPRGSDAVEWMDGVVDTGALSNMRIDQIEQVAERVKNPMQTLARTVKRSLLESKLGEARQLLARVLREDKEKPS